MTHHRQQALGFTASTTSRAANTVPVAGWAANAAGCCGSAPGPGKGASASSRGVGRHGECPNRWVALDPQRGAMRVQRRPATQLRRRRALLFTDKLNFPHRKPTGYCSCDACSGDLRAATALAIGGARSPAQCLLYNKAAGRPDAPFQPIQPTPVVGMVGLSRPHPGTAWPGSRTRRHIWLLGRAAGNRPGQPAKQASRRIARAAGSILERTNGPVTGRPPRTDWPGVARVQALLRESDQQGCWPPPDLSDGAGVPPRVLHRLGPGAELALPTGDCAGHPLLFAKGGARLL